MCFRGLEKMKTNIFNCSMWTLELFGGIFFLICFSYALWYVQFAVYLGNKFLWIGLAWLFAFKGLDIIMSLLKQPLPKMFMFSGVEK